MTAPRVRVLLLGQREVSEELAGSLGAKRVAALSELLGERAARWALASFADAEVVEFDGGLAEAITAVLAGSEGGDGLSAPPAADDRSMPPAADDRSVSLAADDRSMPLTDDGRSVSLADDDAVVLVAPELAVWRDGVGEAALQDLAEGCAFSFGPVFDGGLYLLALSASAIDPLRDAAGLDDLVGRRVLTAVVTLAERAGFEVGMLRTERGLRSVDDVRALLVDPLTDAELRAALG